MACILGRKIAMTQTYGPDGKQIPVTVIEAGPCKVIGQRTKDKDGYVASILGFEEVEGAKLKSKALLGLFKKASSACFKVLHEFRDIEMAAGADATVAQFKEGDTLIVGGFSKGKGMTSVIKKWNFRTGRESHGGNCQRKMGSAGMHTWPAHVIKGKKMAGRWGNDKITLRTVEVVKIVAESNILMVKGPLPGGPLGLVSIQTAPVKGKKKAA